MKTGHVKPVPRDVSENRRSGIILRRGRAGVGFRSLEDLLGPYLRPHPEGIIGARGKGLQRRSRVSVYDANAFRGFFLVNGFPVLLAAIFSPEIACVLFVLCVCVRLCSSEVLCCFFSV